MTVLCYHSVDPRWESPLAVTPGEFAEQAAWLRRHRRVLPVQESLRHFDSAWRLPRGDVVLTFDDGFAGVYEHAFPVLRREGLPASVYLVAETLTEAGRTVDWVRNPGPEPIATLTLDQVLEMQDAGIDFQSHSWAHRDLPLLSEEECVRDLRDSRELLSDLLGRAVTLLVYPRGLHDERVRRAAETAGYTHAFALPEGVEQPGAYAIPRVGIYRGNSLLTMRVKAAPPYLRIRTSATVAHGVQRAKQIARALPVPRR